MSWTKPNDKLTVDTPQVSLFSASFLMSIVLAMIVQLSFQVYVFYTAQSYEDNSFFVECVPSVTNTGNRGHSERVPCTRDTALYLLTIFEYIIVCICFCIFSFDGQFRQPIYKNEVFFVTLCLIVVYNIYKLLWLDKLTRDYFELAEMSEPFKYILLYLVLFNLVLSIFLEYFSNCIFKKWWENKKAKQQE